ncbi:MAG: DUF2169 domain-containing protein [Proteobacteria bacterium]|nr:DUF2169 domain-containing protein [Pseudomonadota bacterium]
MKVYKKQHLSLLIRVLGLKDALYLVTTILVYFDLNDPDHPLKEQDLWQAIPEQLGEQALDMGLPKPLGEVLLTSQCFAPRGSSLQASQVSLRVGDLTKTLNVFGDRYWKKTGGIVHGATEPEPFTVMPITYDRAFGGQGFAPNPMGKGLKPTAGPDGGSEYPLPNIEHPDRLVGSPRDTPWPSGFGPLDPMWTPRSDMVGTYDDKWQAERWPHYPDDFHVEFFNLAPPDQKLNDYLQGDETIEIVNMHPELPVITSRLPSLRVRCFVTHQKDRKAGPEEDLFDEVKTRIDTLWLFPEIMRGVVMYRGTLKVLDEEYADIRRIFLASEKAGEPPKSIEYYFEEQQKEADLSVAMDPAPLQHAEKQIKTALKKIRAIPREIENIKKQAMGKAPRMKRSLSEIHQITKGVISGRLADLDRLETMSRSLHSEFGHKVKINLDMFDRMRTKLQDMGRHIDQTVAHLARTQQEMAAAPAQAEQQLSEFLKKNISPHDLELAGLDPDNLDFLHETTEPAWREAGFDFVVRCRKNLEIDREASDRLAELGLERHTIKRAWLGLNPVEADEEPASWALPTENPGAGREGPLILPAGLVIPRFDDAKLKRIAIRPGDYDTDRDEVLVEGSDQGPLALLIDDGAPVIRAGDDLSAWLVEQEIGDLCSVVALKAPGDQADENTARSIEACSAFLVLLPASQAKSKDVEEAWLGAFPNAQMLPLPEGENVFEAQRKGVDIREWLIEALPPEMARAHKFESIVPLPGQSPGEFKLPALPLSAAAIKGLVDKAIEDVNAAFKPETDQLLAMSAEIEQHVRDSAVKIGLDPDEALAQAKNQPVKSFAEHAEDTARGLAERREALKAPNFLPPGVEDKMKESEAKIRRMGQEAEARWQAGQAELAAGREKIAAARAKAQSGEFPPEIKARMKEYGIDSDKRGKVTREEVIERYQAGDSLSQANMSELDLSGLDLAGIDLKSADCTKTDFSGSNLEGADLSQAVAMEANFSEANLQGAIFQKGLFMKALFKKSDLRRSQLRQALMKGADLTEADLREAVVDMVIFSQAKLAKARLAESDVGLSIFAGADVSETDFAGARLEKCLFKDTLLDKADFSGAAVNSTLFYGAKGAEVVFTGANMDKARLGGKTDLSGADFREASMKEACYRDSDLKGASFQGANLEKAILENCDLSQTDFSKITARKCRLIKSNLEGADLRAVNLFHGSLRKSRLVNADLSRSNLFGVDFYKAVFGNTNLDLTNMKRTQLHGRTEFLE